MCFDDKRNSNETFCHVDETSDALPTISRHKLLPNQKKKVYTLSTQIPGHSLASERAFRPMKFASWTIHAFDDNRLFSMADAVPDHTRGSLG
jgi:hypothetical protein